MSTDNKDAPLDKNYSECGCAGPQSDGHTNPRCLQFQRNRMTQEPSKPPFYKGRGEHSVMQLEHLVEHFIESGAEKIQALEQRVKELEAENVYLRGELAACESNNRLEG